MTLHDDYRELVAAYALDALDGPDRTELEGHLGECTECQALLGDLRRAAVGIGASVDPVAPSAELKARTIAKATGRSSDPPVAAPVVAPPPLSAPEIVPDVVVPAPARRGWAPWLVAAAALLVAAALGFQVWTLRTDIASVRGTLSESALRAESLRAELAEARGDAARLADTMGVVQAPDVMLVALRSTGAVPGPSGRAFVSLSRGIVFDAEGLPPASSGRTYQLWVIPTGFGAPPVSAALFVADSGGRAAAKVGAPAGVVQVLAVAVTDEPAGGSALPTTPAFLVGRPGRN